MHPHDPILQRRLPETTGLDRLPGTAPVGPADWILRDEAFAGQMALRDRLITERPGDVLRLAAPARDAADELLDEVLGTVIGRDGYSLGEARVTRPDGVTVTIDRAAPLATAGRLVQEDLCLLTRGESGEHLLTGAVLCFPASWSLEDKFNRPLTRIHDPVKEYDGAVARRVQRLFDAIRPAIPLVRFNLLRYADPALHQPLAEGAHRERPGRGGYLRSERQCLLRLPNTGAVVFSIHTYVVRAPDK